MSDSTCELEASQQRLKLLLKELAVDQGLCPTVLDGVRLARTDRALPRSPVLYEPSVYIVASGRKIGFVEERRFVYDPSTYLMLAVPLPFEVTTEVGETEPMLGVSVRIDMSIVTELASKMDLAPVGGDIDQIATVQPCPLDVRMSEAAVRLVASLRSPNDAAILGPGIIREIIYHGLSGPHGQVLVEMLSKGSAASKIRAALEWIHNEYAKPLSVPTMADTFGMSISAFHHSFKQVAGASPLQYLKSVRLHKARLFIKYDGLGAAVTAAKVGYESPSQFSRDFKRFFGHPPNREVVRMKALVGADGPEEVFASSGPQYDGRA